MRLYALLVSLVCVLLSPLTLLAQSDQSGPSVSVPRLINVTGVFQPVDGQSPAAVEVVTLSIYAEAAGGLLRKAADQRELQRGFVGRGLAGVGAGAAQDVHRDRGSGFDRGGIRRRGRARDVGELEARRVRGGNAADLSHRGSSRPIRSVAAGSRRSRVCERSR